MVPRPSPCFLDDLERLSRTGPPRWRSPSGDRLYEWDPLHGHVEVYDRRGFHRGVADPVTGAIVKAAIRGRRIDV